MTNRQYMIGLLSNGSFIDDNGKAMKQCLVITSTVRITGMMKDAIAKIWKPGNLKQEVCAVSANRNGSKAR